MKKVLIVAYYWPPAGGPGVQRWLKFVKYLREFDIEPIVYIPENPHYPLKDEALLEEVPDGIIILKKKTLEPYFLSGLLSKKQTKTISSGIITEENRQNLLQKVMLYIRGNFFIPDARKFWVKPSVKFLTEYLQQNNIDTIITTGPPHSVHLIGLKIKERKSLRWIADFRDPWTNIGYHKKLKLSKKAQKKHEELERRVLKKADSIITTSFTTASEFRAKTSTPVTVITNGYDEAPLIEPGLDKSFNIAHIGSLLSGRNPVNLWEVLGDLVEKNEEFRRHLKISLTGAISQEVLNSIKDAGLEGHLRVKDYVSHPEALKLQRKAQVLLLVEIDSEETRGIIPGKLFEYLTAQRPILAIGPKNWDVETILSESGAGKTFSYQDREELEKQLHHFFSLYQKGDLSFTARDFHKFSRRNLTSRLAALIKELS